MTFRISETGNGIDAALESESIPPTDIGSSSSLVSTDAPILYQSVQLAKRPKLDIYVDRDPVLDFHVNLVYNICHSTWRDRALVTLE